jgi:polar amino acid transport system permease protein
LDAIQEAFQLLAVVPTTLEISILSFLLGILIGTPLAFIRSYEKEIAFLVDAYEKVFRGIPEIVLMLLFFFGLGPYFSFPFGNAFLTVVIVLGLRSGANQSQIFRGAIRGVGEEQMVAGRSLGLSRWQTIGRVMIPQVFTFATPGLGSEYALLVKDSAYAFVIGVLELTEKAIMINLSTYETQATSFVIAAVFYILLTFPIATWLDSWGNRQKKKLGI